MTPICGSFGPYGLRSLLLKTWRKQLFGAGGATVKAPCIKPSSTLKSGTPLIGSFDQADVNCKCLSKYITSTPEELSVSLTTKLAVARSMLQKLSNGGEPGWFRQVSAAPEHTYE